MEKENYAVDKLTAAQQETITAREDILPELQTPLTLAKIPFWKRVFLPPARFGQGQNFRITLFIAMAAVMIAMGTVLNAFSFQVAGLGRVSFVYMFMYLSGMLFGPFYGALVAFIADGLGWVLRPEGPYMPLIGLSNATVSMIVGFIFMIPFKKKSLKSVLLIAFVLICAATIMSTYYIGPFQAAQPERLARILERAAGHEFYRNEYAGIGAYGGIGIFGRYRYIPYEVEWAGIYEIVYRYIACTDGGVGAYEPYLRRIFYRRLYTPTPRVYRTDSQGRFLYTLIPATNATGMHNGVRVAIIAITMSLLIFGIYKIMGMKILEGQERELAKNQWFAKMIFAAIVAFVPTTLGLSVWGIHLLIQMGMGGFPPTWNSFSIILMAQLVSQPVWVGINLFLMSILVPALNRSVFKQHPLGECNW